jgi:glycogen synthase
MRVLMTTDTVGGVWTFTQELVCGLLDEGCAIALASIGRAPSREQRDWCLKTIYRSGGNFSFQSIDAPLEWMQGNESAYSGAAPLLLRLAEEFEPDVVHSNQFCFGALPISVPRVITAHSDVLSWASCCCDAPLDFSTWLAQYHSLVYNGLEEADAVVAPTRWMLDALAKNFGLPAKQIVISNGRTFDAMAPSARKLQAVTAGRLWDRAKDIGLLSGIVSPIPLLVAGETELEQSRVPEESGDIRLLGALSQEDLLALFRESAIYICTSQYEPFGLAPLEAALCGCAVLARDIPSLREVWGDDAIYFDSVDTLSQMLHALYAYDKMLVRAQARSLRRALKYSRAAMTSSYLSVFETLTMRSRELTYGS